METRVITPQLLPAFRPYLAPDLADALVDEEEGLIALGAVTEDGHTCGAAAAYADEKTGQLSLRFLLVDPQVRRRGVAALLLDQLEQQAPIVNASWFCPAEDLPALIHLLEARGLLVSYDEDAPIMQLHCAEMQKTPRCRRAFLPGYCPDSNVVPFSQVTQEEFDELCRDETISPDLRPDWFNEDVLTSPLSFAYRYKGVLSAYFLALPVEDGAAVKAAVSRSMAHGAAFFQLASAAIHASLPQMTPTSSYWLEAINDASLTMARYLCSDHYRLWYGCCASRAEKHSLLFSRDAIETDDIS